MTEWILAYDDDCGMCTEVSIRVREAAGSRLTLAGLTDRRIGELRQRALGDSAVWAPTLLAVDGEHVRAWTGRALARRLALRLGPVRSARVLRSLAGAAAVRVPDRRRFLRLAPLAAVGAFALSGGLATPAAAAQQSARAKARAWVAANRANLPTSYDEVTAYPMAHRQAIFSALAPQTRRQLWAEQLARYEAAHRELDAAQRAVLAEAKRALSIAFDDRLSQRDHATLDRLRTNAIAAYGDDGAHALVGRLGAPEQATILDDCTCSTASNWCGGTLYCDQYCPPTGIGCGTMMTYPCDGKCIQF
ncbi:bacteriocin fulvocin C-related protein [Fodinicola acaciae]|uniref:bacteriocin fulvocin C-related protein n=1 Tax=Fodinicola acaciae TaxID=2681555 RepID=UPI0013D105B1|nr:bacteriocin fulvocin C-related protein [Fodinicola acaciae]